MAWRTRSWIGCPVLKRQGKFRDRTTPDFYAHLLFHLARERLRFLLRMVRQVVQIQRIFAEHQARNFVRAF